MSGFDDLLNPLFIPPTGDAAEAHVPGTSLPILVSVMDGDGIDINLSTGFTATCRPETRDGRQAPQWTHSLSGGRQIVLGNGSVRMSATPAASLAAFTNFIGEVLIMTCLVTRTSDGATVPIWRSCFLPIVPRRNP